MRLHLAALLVLTACGTAPAPGPSGPSGPTASTAASTAAPGSEPGSAQDRSSGDAETESSPVRAAAADRAVTAARAEPTPDTPICRGYRLVVKAAPKRFAKLDATSLPGATSCTVIDGGPGHASTATYTCEFGSAATAETLAPKRDELIRALRECGSRRAARSTRVRLVASGGATHLVVNVHDSARW